MWPRFDPSSWWQLPGREPPDERTWLDPWLNMTQWWTGAAVAAPRAFGRPISTGDALAELAAGLARRFESRRIRLDVGGRALSCFLDVVRLTRKEPHGAAIELSDIDYDGLAVPRASIVAEQVRLHLSSEPRIDASEVTVEARLPLGHLVEWLDTQVDGWTLSVDGAGEVRAHDPARRLELKVTPTVRAGNVDLEIRELTWRRFTVGVPRWLRLRRTVTPRLGAGVRLRGAVRLDELVEVHVALESYSKRLDLAALRRAIAQGDTIRLP